MFLKSISHASPKPRPELAWAALILLAVAPLARAHGDLDLQISELTAAIGREPANAELFLRRGEVHRLHGDWASAQRDIDRARELAPDLAVTDLSQARLFLDVKRFAAAEEALDRFLRRMPDHVEGLVTRGRARIGSGKSLPAAEDFGHAIECAKEPDPEYYIDQARSLAAAGSDHIPDAIAALDRGMKRLGKLVTLGLSAVELECARKNFDAALTRLDVLSADQPRKEAWHERRGDVLNAAARPVEAKVAYQSALEAIKILPPHIQNTAAVQQRKERLEGKLKELEAPAGAAR